MGQVKGYVKLDVTSTTGDIKSITVDGSQFGLEDGGDWSRDRDDGVPFAGFLFIAFCDGFDLQLSVSIHGNSITHCKLKIREDDFKEFDIKRVVVTEDELDVSNLFPSEDEDIDW
jgi:hypothetical protein